MTPDLALLSYVVQLRQPWLDEVMLLSSAMAAGGFLWLVLGVIGFVFPERRASAWRLFLVIGLSYLIVDLFLKSLFGRSRPFEALPSLHLIGALPGGASFPSSHAARAFAGALAGSQVFPALGWVLWPFAILVAASRMYLGVHWPSDVVTGAGVGLACAWFVLGGRSRGR